MTFTLDRDDFGFYDNDGKFVVEPGTIDLYAGDSSQATLTKSFTVTRWSRDATHRVTRLAQSRSCLVSRSMKVCIMSRAVLSPRTTRSTSSAIGA